MGRVFQTSRYETASYENRRMGKAQNQSGLLETVEENQNEISNVKSLRFGTLESNGTSHEPKEILAYV